MGPRTFVPLSLLPAATLVVLAPALDAQGRGSFMRTDNFGDLSSIRNYDNWSPSWSLVVPGNFDGSGADDLLFYSRTAGLGRFYSTDGAGGLNRMSNLTTLRTTWELIIPGNFTNSATTDLLFYSGRTGLAAFYRTDGAGGIVEQRVHTNWEHWDEIIPGDFSGNGYTDLLLLSRSRGERRVVRSDGAGNVTLVRQEKVTDWDIVVPGEFDGNGRTDLFIYERTSGRGRFWVSNSSGTGQFALMNEYVSMRTSWDIVVPGDFGGLAYTDLLFYDREAGEAQIVATSGWSTPGLSHPVQSVSKRLSTIVPGNFEPGGRTDMLAYRGRVALRIQAVRVEDDDGGRSTAITPAQVGAWIDQANQVYASAGLHFAFDPDTDFEVVQNSLLNNLDPCGRIGSEPLCVQYHTEATNFANARPCKIVVFFRHGYGTPTVDAIADANWNYIAMPAFDRAVTTAYYLDPDHPQHDATVQDRKLLARALGHYLGLPNTFIDIDYSGSADPHQAVLDLMTAAAWTQMSQLDSDATTVLDTPPDVGQEYYTLNGWNPADLSQQIRIQSAAQGFDFTFSPDRHNVMSDFGICDDYVRISRDQARRIRRWLQEPHRQSLRDPCAQQVSRGGRSSAPAARGRPVEFRITG